MELEEYMLAKIVKCRSPRGSLVYSVRLDQGEIETELLAFPTEADARQVIEALSQLSENSEAVMYAMAALLQIHQIAICIGTANDQQGTEAYATKAHMRAWGEQVFNIVTFTLKYCGFDVKPDHIIVPKAGPAIAEQFQQRTERDEQGAYRWQNR